MIVMIDIFRNSLNNREFELLNAIHHDTLSKLKLNALDEIGCDATTLSNQLFIERSNVSRTLNRLCRNGLLTKIQGRPTLYFDKAAVAYYFPEVFLPDILPLNVTLLRYLEENHAFNIRTGHIFANFFGTLEQEALFNLTEEAKAALYYPSESLSLLLYGQEHTGKREFAKRLFAVGLNRRLFANKEAYYYLDCNDCSESTSFSKTLEAILMTKTTRKFIVIDSFHLLTDKEQHKLKKIINEKSYFSPQEKMTIRPNCMFLLLTSEPSFDPSQFTDPFSITLDMPSLDQRTMKEKLLFILSFFQKEADAIQKIIRFSYNVLNCFTLSRYPRNILSLELEIKRAIALAFHQQVDQKSPINLTFDHLSDNLLNNMQTDTQMIDELYHIYHLLTSPIDKNDIALMPNQESLLTRFIEKNILYDRNHLPYNKLLIATSKESTDSPRELVRPLLKQFYNKKLNLQQLSHPQLVTEIQVHFSSLGFDQSAALLNGLVAYFDPLLSNQDDSLADHTYESMTAVTQACRDFLSYLKQQYHFKANEHEALFLQTYIEDALLIAQNSRPAIVVVTGTLPRGEIYTTFANSLPYTTKVISMEAAQLLPHTQTLTSHLKRLDEGKGIVFLINDDVPKEVVTLLSTYPRDYLVIDKMTIQTLEKVVRLSDNPFNFIEDLSRALQPDGTCLTGGPDTLIPIIKQDILDKSLVFLNPTKIVDSAVSVFYAIIHELQMAYDDSLFIRFLLHVSFMVERMLLENCLTYQNINLFINEHHEINTVIDRQMTIIRTTYNIIIPQSEIAYITEIFLDGK